VEGYLTKPVMASELQAAIQVVLSDDGRPPESRPLVTRHTLREARTRLKILLAEDTLVIRSLAVRLLEKRGHQVRAVEDGAQALAALDQEPFDLLLTDIEMPKMNGFDLAKTVRRRERDTRLPIVALTAHGTEQRGRCLEAGMDACVGKP